MGMYPKARSPDPIAQLELTSPSPLALTLLRAISRRLSQAHYRLKVTRMYNKLSGIRTDVANTCFEIETIKAEYEEDPYAYPGLQASLDELDELFKLICEDLRRRNVDVIEYLPINLCYTGLRRDFRITKA